MQGRPTRRFGRRAFLRLFLAVGVALVGGQIVRKEGWAPSDLATMGESDELMRLEEGPPSVGSGTAAPVVAIVRGNDPTAMVRSAVTLAGRLDQVVRKGATVLIKPNLTIPSASGLGNVTGSEVLRATIELCQQAGAARVLVGDGSGGGDTEQIMRQAGYDKVLKDTGASFVDFNRDVVVTRRLSDADGLAEYSLAKTAIETPVFISLAVLKIHNEAIVSLTCKNLIGITSRPVYGQPRQRLHNAGVQRVIADLVRIRKPDFAIIDGVVGLEGDSPMHGTPVPMNLIIAGRNPVSVDAVGTAVMGYDPRQVEQLVLLNKRGIGEIDLMKILVRGNSVTQVQRRFKV